MWTRCSRLDLLRRQIDVTRYERCHCSLGSSHCSVQFKNRGAGRVSGQGGQNSAQSAEKNVFRLPTLVFSLPTLPYVTVAHPAHRTEADLREKASLATNQEGPLRSPLLPSV